LVIGSMVTGSVRSIQSYGAFVDIGAQTDGLLHISQLSSGYVASVGDVIKEGEEVQVRIVSIDTAKGQVALSMMSQEEAADSQQAAQQQQNRPKRQSGGRRDDSAALASLNEKGWDTAGFVEGTVVSTVDFGCFVRIDTSLLNSECEGQLDGLVHISALRAGRVSSVTDVVSVDEKVKVRVKSIAGSKVSLTMMSVEEEEAKSEERGGGGGSFGGGGGFEGAKDWKESLEKMDATQPSFTNRIIVEDRRK
jgi:elongation factor Ts